MVYFILVGHRLVRCDQLGVRLGMMKMKVCVYVVHWHHFILLSRVSGGPVLAHFRHF